MTLKTEAMVRVLVSCEQVMKRSYYPNCTRGNEPNCSYNATFFVGFCRRMDVAGNAMDTAQILVRSQRNRPFTKR
jgi:hypothetical protein